MVASGEESAGERDLPSQVGIPGMLGCLKEVQITFAISNPEGSKATRGIRSPHKGLLWLTVNYTEVYAWGEAMALEG